MRQKLSASLKGKAHKRYEFGVKVILLITHKQGLALNSEAITEIPMIDICYKTLSQKRKFSLEQLLNVPSFILDTKFMVLETSGSFLQGKTDFPQNSKKLLKDISP